MLHISPAVGPLPEVTMSMHSMDPPHCPPPYTHLSSSHLPKALFASVYISVPTKAVKYA